jgi:hypothetical protein
MAWETLLASVDITIGEHVYHAAIIRRGVAPEQTYHIMKHGAYHAFEGKGDDDTATVLGIAQIGLLLGRELGEFAQPKGPKAEQVE